jgi:hypothetical protein
LEKKSGGVKLDKKMKKLDRLTTTGEHNMKKN